MNNRQPDYEEVYDDALEDDEEVYEQHPRPRRNRGMTNMVASAVLLFIALAILGGGYWFYKNGISKIPSDVITTNPTADAMNTQASQILTQVVTGQQGALVVQPTAKVLATPTSGVVPVSTLDNGCLTAQVVYSQCDNTGSCSIILLGSNDVFVSSKSYTVGETATLCK